MSNSSNDLTDKELELLTKEKLAAEIAILRKTTPVAEAIKLVFALILGVIGIFACFSWYQLSKAEALMAKIEKDKANDERDRLKEEYNFIQEQSNTSLANFDKMSNENQRLEGVIRDQLAKLEGLKKLITDAETIVKASASSAAYKTIRDQMEKTSIDLRAQLVTTPFSFSQKPPIASIEGLFELSGSARGAAYEDLVGNYSASKILVPELLEYAEPRMDNDNGIYNTLVVLNHIDQRALKSDPEKIRSFAEKAKGNGPKTAERADKVLQRLDQYTLNPLD